MHTATANSQRSMSIFCQPQRWLLHPWLPVSRRTHGYPELGVIVDTRSYDVHGYDCCVFLVNMFDAPGTWQEMLDLPKIVYDTLEELAADGWLAD